MFENGHGGNKDKDLIFKLGQEVSCNSCWTVMTAAGYLLQSKHTMDAL